MSIAFSVRCEDSYLYWMVTTEDDYWPRFSAAALRTMESAQITVGGRHDPCIVPRAVPCVEAAAAVAVYDALLSHCKEKRG